MVTRKQVGNWLQQYKRRINEQFLKKKKKKKKTILGACKKCSVKYGGKLLSVYLYNLNSDIQKIFLKISLIMFCMKPEGQIYSLRSSFFSFKRKYSFDLLLCKTCLESLCYL